MTVAFATAQELSDWLGDAAVAANATRADLILGSASVLIRTHTKRQWLEGEALIDPIPDGLKAVALTVAAREWTNPTQATQTTEVAGQFTKSESRPTGSSLYLTRSERAMLDAAVKEADGETSTIGGLVALDIGRYDTETDIQRIPAIPGRTPADVTYFDE